MTGLGKTAHIMKQLAPRPWAGQGGGNLLSCHPLESRSGEEHHEQYSGLLLGLVAVGR